MALLIDPDVAIHLRDGDPTINEGVRGEGASPVISVLTLVELEAGAADDVVAGHRRIRLEAMLAFVPVLPYTRAEAAAYGRIVGTLGFDRRRMFDRMIAAQAIVAGLPLATINGRDYRGIPDLDLLVSGRCPELRGAERQAWSPTLSDYFPIATGVPRCGRSAGDKYAPWCRDCPVVFDCRCGGGA